MKGILWQKCRVINARSQVGFKWLPSCHVASLLGEQGKPRQSKEITSLPVVAENLPWAAKVIRALSGGGPALLNRLWEPIFRIRCSYEAAKWWWLKSFKYQIVCKCTSEIDLHLIVLQGKKRKKKGKVTKPVIQQEFNVCKFGLDDWRLKYISSAVFCGQSCIYLALTSYLLVTFHLYGQSEKSERGKGRERITPLCLNPAGDCAEICQPYIGLPRLWWGWMNL